MIISFSKLGGGGGYVLPAATQSTLGGVKVGSGLTIDNGGTLSVSGGTGGSGVQVVSDLSEITDPTDGMRAFIPKGCDVNVQGWRFSFPSSFDADFVRNLYDDAILYNWGQWTCNLSGFFGYRSGDNNYERYVNDELKTEAYFPEPEAWMRWNAEDRYCDILFKPEKFYHMRIGNLGSDITATTITAVCKNYCEDMGYTYHETPLFKRETMGLVINVNAMDKTSDASVAKFTVGATYGDPKTFEVTLSNWNNSPLGKFKIADESYGHIAFLDDNNYRFIQLPLWRLFYKRFGDNLQIGVLSEYDNVTVTSITLSDVNADAQAIVVDQYDIYVEYGWESDTYCFNMFTDSGNQNPRYSDWKEWFKASIVGQDLCDKISKRWSARFYNSENVSLPVGVTRYNKSVTINSFIPSYDNGNDVKYVWWRAQWAPEAGDYDCNAGLYWRHNETTLTRS